MTHDCVPRYATNHILKFTKYTTVVGLIRDDNDWAYREEVKQLVGWNRDNSLILNVDKTKEIIVDLWKIGSSHYPLHINNTAVEVVSSTKFLGVQDKLTWPENTASLVKRAQQCMYFLGRAEEKRRAHLPPPILTIFYRSTTESILTNCISVWCGVCSAVDWKNVRRVGRMAEKIIWFSIPFIQDIAQKALLIPSRKVNHGPLTPPSWSVFPAGLWKEVPQYQDRPTPRTDWLASPPRRDREDSAQGLVSTTAIHTSCPSCLKPPKE